MRALWPILLLPACTVLSDLDKYACAADADCERGRICSANGFCIIPTLECRSTEDCRTGDLCVGGQCQPEATARWSCLDDPPEAPLSGPSTVTLRLSVKRRTGAGDSAVTAGQVQALACATASCQEPVGPFVSDGTGTVDVRVSEGFEGLLKLTGTGLLDTLYQLQGPLNEDVVAPAPITLLRAEDVAQLATDAGASFDLTGRSLVLFQVFDCVDDPVAGVSVSEAGEGTGATIFYLDGAGKPRPGATSTSSSGAAAAGGVTEGERGFDLTRASTQEALDALQVPAVAGGVTYVPYQFGR